MITAEQMRDLPVSSLYDVVQRLHPEWFTQRQAAKVAKAPGASTSDNSIQVYLGRQHVGNTDVLKQMSPNGTASLKYYSASEAQGRFGNGNLNGAIQVLMVGAKP